jgi:hypothetical protein
VLKEWETSSHSDSEPHYRSLLALTSSISVAELLLQQYYPTISEKRELSVLEIEEKLHSITTSHKTSSELIMLHTEDQQQECRRSSNCFSPNIWNPFHCNDLMLGKNEHTFRGMELDSPFRQGGWDE